MVPCCRRGANQLGAIATPPPVGRRNDLSLSCEVLQKCSIGTCTRADGTVQRQQAQRVADAIRLLGQRRPPTWPAATVLPVDAVIAALTQPGRQPGNVLLGRRPCHSIRVLLSRVGCQSDLDRVVCLTPPWQVAKCHGSRNSQAEMTGKEMPTRGCGNSGANYRQLVHPLTSAR
jgi:hypothetical protein